MGVATGDFDNDGWVDLYLTKFDAPNQLFRNNGDGTFTDVSNASGTDQHSWSVSASFVDIDRDGWLDLFVGNYLRYRLEGNTQVLEPDRCSRLLHARQLSRRCPTACTAIDGTGRSPMSRRAAHVASEFGPALGVSTADFNGDGWIDIYVANDGKENQLWLNRRDGTFENGALLAGVALPQSGKAEGSMGVDAGDFDNDGDEDLVMTELTAEGQQSLRQRRHGRLHRRERRRRRSGRLACRSPGSAPCGWTSTTTVGSICVAANGTVQIVEALRQARRSVSDASEEAAAAQRRVAAGSKT